MIAGIYVRVFEKVGSDLTPSRDFVSVAFSPTLPANFQQPRVRATATATDKPTNADHLAVVLITDGTTTALDFDIAANGLQVTYYNDSSEEVAVTGNFLNGDLTEMQPGQAFIFFHIGGGSWIFK